jgi:hypothetical protein
VSGGAFPVQTHNFINNKKKGFSKEDESGGSEGKATRQRTKEARANMKKEKSAPSENDAPPPRCPGPPSHTGALHAYAHPRTKQTRRGATRNKGRTHGTPCSFAFLSLRLRLLPAESLAAPLL